MSNYELMAITDWHARNEAKAQAEIDRRASIAARLQVVMDVYMGIRYIIFQYIYDVMYAC